MTVSLENHLVRWTLDQDEGRWGFEAIDPRAPKIIQAGLGIEWGSASGPRSQPRLLQGASEADLPEPAALEGAKRMVLEGKTGEPLLQATLEVEIPSGMPLVMMRLTLENRGGSDVVVGDLGMMSAGRAKNRRRPAWAGLEHSETSQVKISCQHSRLRFYANGWQGWSPSGGLGPNDRQPWTRLGPITSPIFHNPSTGKPLGRGHFVSDMFGVLVDSENRTGLLAGFLTQTQAFGSLRASLPPPGPGLMLWQAGDRVLLRPEASFRSDWACVASLSFNDEDPLGAYLDLAGRLGGARIADAAPTGWSSWYTFFETVDPQAVTQNLDWLGRNQARLPLRIGQLDDGFEANVGQWEAFSPDFGDGVKPIAERAIEAGLVPGLWLAPFIVKPRSTWAKEHPDWVLRSPAGRPVSAGYNWSAFTLGLDPTHPGVHQAVHNLVRRAVDAWGFKFLKFDFLYAASLPGVRYDPTCTRAQALRRGLELLREAAGEDVWLLGCGCPLGSGIGIFDSMRIGPDVAPRWAPAFQGIGFYFGKEPSLPSARNSVQASLGRSMLNRRWWINDPDCLLARSADTHLTAAEVQCLLSVAALSSGALIDSDDLPTLEPERSDWLARLLPPMVERARVQRVFETGYPELISMALAGSLGRWWLVGVINWDDRPRQLACRPKDVGLDPDAAWWGVNYWREEVISLGPGTWSFEVPPHGIHLMALRRRTGSGPAWLGDTLHISQGLQVAAWETGTGRLRAILDAGREMRGGVWLGLPGKPTQAWLDGRDIACERVAPGVYRLEIEAKPGSELEVAFGLDTEDDD